MFDSKFIRNLLSNIHIQQSSFDWYEVDNVEPRMDFVVNKATVDIVDRIKVNWLFKNVHKRLGGLDRDVDLFGIVIMSYISRFAVEAAEVLLFCEEIQKHTDTNPVIFMQKNIVSNAVVNIVDRSFTNIEPKFFSVLEFTIVLILKILSKIFNILKSFFILNKFRLINGNPKHSDSSIKCDTRSLGDFKVAYLPHGGVFYNTFFIKDQYYSSDPNSPFFNANILHIMYGHKSDSDKRTIEYYSNNNIKSIQFNQIHGLLKSVILKDIVWYVFRIVSFRNWKNVDHFILIAMLIALVSVRSSICRLNTLKSLKILLYGYDVLFPKTISYACKLSNITTVASQERYFFPWSMSSIIVDHYFTIGPNASEKIRKTSRYVVAKCHDVGSARLDDIYNKVCKLDDRKKLLKGCKYLSLVFDIMSTSDIDQNSRGYSGWKSNKKFYNTIIKMARTYPDTMFLIKGKNTNFLHIEYFKDVVFKINLAHNIVVMNDVDIYTVSPYYLVAIADFSIAIYTSIADEMLQSGKPVILYDGVGKGIPRKCIGFDDRVVSRTEQDLSEKIKQITVTKEYKLSNKLSKLYFINPRVGSVKLSIRQELKKIFSS
jgi:hypothetical protein